MKRVITLAGVIAAVERVRPADYEIINLGGSSTIALADLIATIEGVVGRAAKVERRPDQPGAV